MSSLNPTNKSLAVITPFGSANGIAEHSQDLYAHIADKFSRFTIVANSDNLPAATTIEADVIRLWKIGDPDFSKVIDWVEKNKPDFVHIQHHPALISLEGLKNLLAGLASLPNRPRIILTAHTVKGNSIDLTSHNSLLDMCDRIVVHRELDIELLSKHAVKLALQPLPFVTFTLRNKQELRAKMGISTNDPVIATHGIMGYHKGLLQTLEAIAQLKQKYPQILWLAINAVTVDNISSSTILQQLSEGILRYGLQSNVRVFTPFLSAPEVGVLLQAADIGVLPYDEVGESASAAARKFMSTGVPLIHTEIPMLQESAFTFRISDNKPATIVSAIEQLWENETQRTQLRQESLTFANQHSYAALADAAMQVYS